MSSNISKNPDKATRPVTERLATMIIRLRLLIITGLLGVITVFQTVTAYAAPGDGEGSFSPPKWCPMPTYKTSAGVTPGLNDASQEISGWAVVVLFFLGPLVGIIFILFSRYSETGKKAFKKLGSMALGITIVILGSTVLGILFVLIGYVTKAIFKAVCGG